MNIKDYYTVAQLAKKSGYTPRRIQQLLKSGELQGVRLGYWFVLKKDGDDWLKRINKKPKSD